MRLIIAKDYQDLSRKAANIIAAQVQLKPDCVLGLATGSSPVGTYQELIAKYQSGDLDFSKVTTVNLDEYVGLDKDHDQSYAYFMRTNLFDHVNIDQANCNIPNGMDPDAEKECARYDAVIASVGGADLQLLGLGPNGHIGFNEPAEEFVKNTNKVTLTDSTIEANARFFEKKEDVPTHAYTMGIGAIMTAKRVLLVASGANKAQAVKDCFFGPITPHAPGSILQLHSDFILVADEAALSLVKDQL
ncbi:MAG: glucosamine-6-phosphate deaminase [Oscillospiraceae bacterium]|nr:glucosamine-6-phosphate deaminase [Oscillospiraceae bacterium]